MKEPNDKSDDTSEKQKDSESKPATPKGRGETFSQRGTEVKK